MKNQTISTDAQCHAAHLHPEFRGNLFLGLLLGVHLLIALSQSTDCAYAQTQSDKTVDIQTHQGC